ncbi:Zn-dependent alcohol dehydrogenase [uncultured Arthrobacter sp.]|uniref:Zn-dependent alcohol dehydrogenase n=1 Tax=uncultured Arthrobacter sp. TaxID=114050 RepID=UPI0025F27B0F|nr:Zn-dependent alcohol dehydrogenase [uncultured Arthrobacter sp.]
MKTRAALVYETNQQWDLGKQFWKIEELEIAPLGPDDVLVHLPYSGVCHTDLHPLTGDLPPAMLPMIGGHEGAGVVEDVGSRVGHVQPGDHVVISILPACGHCRYCRRGRPTLCDMSAIVMGGRHPDGEFRYTNSQQQAAGQWSLVGSFAEYVVVNSQAAVKIPEHLPLDVASMVGCAVTTGFGAAVDKAGVGVGDSVVVWGCGGVGLSAVQGAALAGAAEVIAVDTNDFKLEVARSFGATATFNPNVDRSPNPNRDEAAEKVMEYTNWQGVDVALLCVDYVTPELTGAAFATLGKGGKLVIVGVTHPKFTSIAVSGLEVTFWEKEIVGCSYGGGNPTLDMPRNLRMYEKGQLKLDEMITKRYPLESVNEAFDDLLNGQIVKGVIEF